MKKNFQQKGDCLDKTKQKDCSDKKNKNPGQNEKKSCPGDKKKLYLALFFKASQLYLQAPCQVELENWVNSIHSACAAAFAR